MKRTLALGLMASLVAGSVFVMTPQAANADYKTRVNKRQRHQQQRLFGGASNGSLTGREYKRLQKQQQALALKEAQMRKSGCGLTKKEAVKLEAGQDALSQNIYQQKHDAQNQPQ